jgi:Kef-type K+ transport system membrane component KefB
VDAEHGHPVLVIMTGAALAPFVTELALPVRVPTVVIEVLYGILVGPFGLGLVEPTGLAGRLAEFGLAALFFHAGLEIDFGAIRGRPLRLAAAGWLLSLALASAAALALRAVGVVEGTWYVGAALTTTAIGTLLPILRDTGELNTPFGSFVLAAGAFGEFGPIVLLSLLLGGSDGVGRRSLLLIAFATVAAGVCAVALRARPPRVVALLSRTLQTSSQLPIRISLLLICALFVLAKDFGLDVILGAFAAGMVVGLVSRGPGVELFHHKLDAVGFGFLVPIFFVMSGAQLDLGSLLRLGTLVRVPLFLALFLLVRGLPAVLSRHDLDRRDCLAQALYSATALPIVIAITTIGIATGHLRPDNAAALVGAGVLSVLILPAVAMALRTRPSRSESESRSAESERRDSLTAPRLPPQSPSHS